MLKNSYRFFYILFLAGVMFSLLGGTLFHQPFRVASVSALDMAGLHKSDIDSCDRKIDGILLWRYISEAWMAKVRTADSWKEYKEIFKVPNVEMQQHGFIDKFAYEPMVKTTMYWLRLSLFMFSFSFLFIAVIFQLVHGSLSLRRRVRALEIQMALIEGAMNARA